MVISLTVLADSIYNILIFSAEKNVSKCKSYSHFFSKKFQHICLSLDVNFNESLTTMSLALNNWAQYFLAEKKKSNKKHPSYLELFVNNLYKPTNISYTFKLSVFSVTKKLRI